MAATVQLVFWSRFSSDASIRSMMLHNDANQLEESDRKDILNSLPDFTDMFVVDIGAGIGRFTTNFAKKAKHVLSVDFIKSFIEQNKMRNNAFNNITYQVNDALGLQVEPGSVDLLFSNWLLMYLNDNEVVEFLLKSMKALKPEAFLHLRESCTESSTNKSTKGSLQLDANPTHYRHASVYINLLRKLRWWDKNNQSWRLQILFSNSVPTYIDAAANWRQVHWLVKKVPTEEKTSVESLNMLVWSMSQSMIVQNHVELMLSNKSSWVNEIFKQALESLDLFSSDDSLLTYSPRMIDPFLFVDVDAIVSKSLAKVWMIEVNPYAYCERLTKANLMKNKRVRYSWVSSLSDTLIYWRLKNAFFHGFVATELLLSTDKKTLEELSHVLAPKAHILFIEPILSLSDFNEKYISLIEQHFQLVSVKDISNASFHRNVECQQKQEFNSPSPNASWLLVHARNR